MEIKINNVIITEKEFEVIALVKAALPDKKEQGLSQQMQLLLGPQEDLWNDHD